MSAERIDMHRLQELVRLHRLSHDKRTVARLLGMSPNTERDYRQLLQPHGVLQGDPKQLPELGALQELVQACRPPAPTPPSSLDSYRPQIQELHSRGNQPQAIYDELRQKYPELQGKRSALKRLCKRLKKETGIAPSRGGSPSRPTPATWRRSTLAMWACSTSPWIK